MWRAGLNGGRWGGMEAQQDSYIRAVALGNEILRGVVGSVCHGTSLGEAADRDEMGIFIEPLEYVCGLTSIDHYIYRDAAEGERSGPGDLDLTLYSLRKYCRLTAGGNPSTAILLWLPSYIYKGYWGGATHRDPRCIHQPPGWQKISWVFDKPKAEPDGRPQPKG